MKNPSSGSGVVPRGRTEMTESRFSQHHDGAQNRTQCNSAQYMAAAGNRGTESHGCLRAVGVHNSVTNTLPETHFVHL